MISQPLSEMFLSPVVDEDGQDTAELLCPTTAHEARMYSLEQLFQLWMLFFRRSSVGARLD